MSNAMALGELHLLENILFGLRLLGHTNIIFVTEYKENYFEGYRKNNLIIIIFWGCRHSCTFMSTSIE